MSKYFISLLFAMNFNSAVACDACKLQQPKITQGITHGAGPESNWDWVIVAFVIFVALMTLLFSIKFIIWPGEKNANHIKQTILLQ